MIVCISCNCGSVDSLIRNFLQKEGYQDWLTVPIHKGKERSRKLVQSLPQYPEVQMINSFLNNASKWAVIIGYNENGCRWSDISHNPNKSRIEASFIVKTFA